MTRTERLARLRASRSGDPDALVAVWDGPLVVGQERAWEALAKEAAEFIEDVRIAMGETP